MTMVEFFSFLPYGKYAFYVWFAYGVSAVTIITLFISAKGNHSNTLLSLSNKYLRNK
ncbi:MAG: heme exporter protein CcmD [Pseudomonadota bacterium]|nr:heme exporter protein CcmD [Pseudomonadota bacterium]